MQRPTKFIEANIILLAQLGEHGEALELMKELLPVERRTLAESCEWVAGHLRDRNL